MALNTRNFSSRTTRSFSRGCTRRSRWIRLASITSTVTAMLISTQSWGFKPYTHVHGAKLVLESLQNRSVEIKGRRYAVRREVADAIKAWPQFYQAGSIGPDGFPDIVYGQSVVHPNDSGVWLKHLFDRAWEAQNGTQYNDEEKAQILAFAYGYLSHAAADLWSHTLVNDLSLGVFPPIKSLLSNKDKASIAFRHIVIEGYIGDATPGFDGNPDWKILPDGDQSPDSTPGFELDAPHRWIYDVFVDPHQVLPVGVCGDGIDDDGDGVVDDGCPNGPFSVGAPEPQRGLLVDAFLDLQAKLEEEATKRRRQLGFPRHFGPTCVSFNRSIEIRTVRGEKSARLSYKVPPPLGEILCWPDLTVPFDPLLVKYLENWSKDIESKLPEWNRVGTAITRSLFDPQTYRDVANKICQGDTGISREQCEAKVGIDEVLSDQLDPLLNEFLLSMVGFPDKYGVAREKLSEIADFLSQLGPLNPLGPATNLVKEIEERIKNFIKEEIRRTIGIDVDILESFLKNPTHWLKVQSVDLKLAGIEVERIDLFSPGTHRYLGDLMGLKSERDVRATVAIPNPADPFNPEQIESSRLADDAVFGETGSFAVFDNAVMLSKLALLDAAGLNQVIADQLGDGLVAPSSSVVVYQDHAVSPANVMVDGMDSDGPVWLNSLDSDHAWRQDALPRFLERPEDEVLGGVGVFPLWEDCVARPAFRELFVDWQTDRFRYPGLLDFPDEQPGAFPDLGDTASPGIGAPDPATVDDVLPQGPSFEGDTLYMGSGAGFVVDLASSFFDESKLKAQYRILGSSDEAWRPVNSDLVVPVDVESDGAYSLEVRVGGPCHPVAGARVSRLEFERDTTAPEVTIVSPEPDTVFDTASSVVVEVSAEDTGAGVASIEAMFAGEPIDPSSTIDTFLLPPGEFVISASSVDNVDNRSETIERMIRVEATLESLLANIARAIEEGLIPSRPRGIANSIQQKLKNAMKHHRNGRINAEINVLEALTRELRALSGKKIDQVFAERILLHVENLITRRRSSISE